ncbi:hypothetical protein AMTRI_Chr10g228600 [Amborella trichopoda]
MAHHHPSKGMVMKGVGPVPGSYPVVVVRIFFASLFVTSMDGDGPSDPAKDVVKDALQDRMSMCQHVRGTFDKAVIDFNKKGAKGSRQSNTKGGRQRKRGAQGC